MSYPILRICGLGDSQRKLGPVVFVLPYPTDLVRVVVVSEIMVYYKISKSNINDQVFWTKLVSSLQHSLLKQQSLENKILVVKLQDITNDDHTMIPKLEHKKI